MNNLVINHLQIVIGWRNVTWFFYKSAVRRYLDQVLDPGNAAVRQMLCGAAHDACCGKSVASGLAPNHKHTPDGPLAVA
jgi:hypothetical protein